jgi:hypothetical protein
MDKRYHVNPKTGEASICRAFLSPCPFAHEEDHHATAEEARAAFETTQQELTLPRPVRKSKPVKVYRIGSLEPQQQARFEDLGKAIAALDQYCPEGRQPRGGALFASPDLESHGRWVRGVRKGESHELTVNPDEVYIYPVALYEEASQLVDSGLVREDERPARLKAAVEAFWVSGMTLTEWREWRTTTDVPHGSWELLLPPTAVMSAKPVSNRRIIEHAHEDDASQLNFQLELRRAQQGLIWRKKKSADA